MRPSPGSLRIAVALAGVACAAAAVGACGGGAESDAERQAVTRTEFVSKARAICRRERASLAAEARAHLRRQGDRQPQGVLNAGLAQSVLLPAVEAEVEAVWMLPRPPEDDKRIDEMLSAQRIAIDNVAVQSSLPSVKVVDRYFAEPAAMLERYGLSPCAVVDAGELVLLN